MREGGGKGAQRSRDHRGVPAGGVLLAQKKKKKKSWMELASKVQIS